MAGQCPMNYWSKLVGGMWTKRQMMPINQMPTWMARQLGVRKA